MCGSSIAAGEGQRGLLYCPTGCKPRRSVWNRDLLTKRCAVDAVEFTTRYVRQIHCSDLCRNRAMKRRRYKAGSRRRFGYVRGRARVAIFERDGWRCQICGAVIDQALRWPHPGSSSIDHRDPNGPHDPTNWQASHLGCNVEKGAKAA